jgi:hypothetical protein
MAAQHCYGLAQVTAEAASGNFALHAKTPDFTASSLRFGAGIFPDEEALSVNSVRVGGPGDFNAGSFQAVGGIGERATRPSLKGIL